MKFLHICSNEKFINSFIEFINTEFNSEEHYFIVIQDKQFNIITGKNINTINSVQYNVRYLKTMMNKSEKIFFHSLINDHLIYLLFFNPKLLNKSYWMIWGADLYRYLNRHYGIKNYLKHLIFKSVVSRISGLITHIKGDFELAQKWYGARGNYYYSFMYPSNLSKTYSDVTSVIKDDKIYVQLGNSADPSNNHIEILEMLKMFRDHDIKIICPLSYGNKDYSRQVVEYGEKIFHDKFIPIIDFLPFDEYLNILAKIDVAIFNHKRQQAMGNITTLVGLGKKVYIREEITTWQFCIDHGLKVYNANGDFADLYDAMDEDIRKKNIENVKMKFSKEKLVNDWDEIFRGDAR
jgi:hypothetical protein